MSRMSGVPDRAPPAGATVHLVRHGMHDWLLPGRNRLAGRLPGVHLNRQGREEAERLAARLRGEPLAWVASSPLERTLETAEIIARPHGLAVVPDPRLLEWAFGPWEGMEIDAIRRADPRRWELWRQAPDLFSLAGAETLQEVAERMEAAYREWAGRGGVGVMVSHQDPLAALLCRLVGAPLRAMRALEVPTGALATCRETPWGTVLVRLNPGFPTSVETWKVEGK